MAAASTFCGSQPQVLAYNYVTPEAMANVHTFHVTGCGSQPHGRGQTGMCG